MHFDINAIRISLEMIFERSSINIGKSPNKEKQQSTENASNQG